MDSSAEARATTPAPESRVKAAQPVSTRWLAAFLVALLVSVTQEQAPYRVASAIVLGMVLLVLVLRRTTLEDNHHRFYSTLLAWFAGGLCLWLMVAGWPEVSREGLRHAVLFGARAYLPLLGFVIVCSTGVVPPWHWLAAMLITGCLHAATGYLELMDLVGVPSQLPRGLSTWHTHLGELLALCVTLAWAWFWVDRSRRRWIAWGVIGFVFPVLVFTSARSAYLTVVLGPVLAYLVASPRLTWRRVFGLGLGVLGLAALAIGLLSLVSKTSIADDKFTLHGMLTKSVGERSQMLQETWMLFLERPWIGWGNDVDVIFNGTQYARPHNIYLEMAACTGVIGLVLWLAVTSLGLYGWWRVRRVNRWLGATGLALMAQVLFGALFHHSMLDDPLLQTYWAALIGCGAGYACAARPGGWLNDEKATA